MKKGRFKVRVCLISIVLAAIIIGMIYYCSIYEDQYIRDEGILVKDTREVEHVC